MDLSTRNTAWELLKQQLPQCVVIKTGLPMDRKLFPVEDKQIANATQSRRQQYATGRWLARQALTALNYPQLSITNRGELGPDWPQGIVGSISHCKKVVCVALARNDTLSSIGIDVELEGRLSQQSFKRILTTNELNRLQGLNEQEQLTSVSKIFSAKEATYKSISYAWNLKFGFKDISIELSLSDGSFLVHPEHTSLQKTPWEKLEGHAALSLGLIVTTAVIRP